MGLCFSLTRLVKGDALVSDDPQAKYGAGTSGSDGGGPGGKKILDPELAKPKHEPPRPKHDAPSQKEYGFDEGEKFDDSKFAGPPEFCGLLMPPPPVLPPPANTFPYPPNAETYARAQVLRWGQRILLDEFGEAKGAHHSDGEASGDDESGDDESGDDVDDSSKHGKKGGTGDTAKRDGKVNKAPAEASANRKSKAAHQPKSPVPGKTNHLPKSDSSNEVYLCSPNWYERIERVEIVFVVFVNGKELSHSVDWRSPVPPNVVKMFTNETYGAAFQSPALGMYHERVKHIGHKAEDAALVAAIEYVAEWATMAHDGFVLDPFRDVRNISFVFHLVTKKGKRKTASRRHEGAPDDRMYAFKAAITRVRGW